MPHNTPFLFVYMHTCIHVYTLHIYLSDLPVLLEALSREERLWGVREVAVERKQLMNGLHSLRLPNEEQMWLFYT